MKNVTNPAHNLKNSKKIRHKTKHHPIEQAIAYFVTFKSDIQLENFWLKNEDFPKMSHFLKRHLKKKNKMFIGIIGIIF